MGVPQKTGGIEIIRHRTSISLRLAVGFALVLIVLGIVLLLTLSHMARLKKASENQTVYLEARHQALQINQLAKEVSRAQSAFVRNRVTDPEQWNQLQDLSYELRHMIQPLRARHLDRPETDYADRLYEAARSLRTIVQEQRRAATAASTAADPKAWQSVAEHSERSRKLFEELIATSQSLANSLHLRTLAASEQANLTWTLSIVAAETVFPIALLVSLLVVYLTHRSIVQPVATLVKRTQSLARGDLSQRLELEGYGEFAELANSFNRMAETLEANQKKLIEAEKLASIGRLSAGVAHEINNPITVILGYTQILSSSLEQNDPNRECIENVAAEARECKKIVDSLLDMSRPPSRVSGQALNPSEVVDEVLGVTQALHLMEGTRVEHSVIDHPLDLDIGRSRLRQLTLNIVRNALEALKGIDNARLLIEGYVRPRQKLTQRMLADTTPTSGPFLILSFKDNGPGIPKEQMAHLLEPFYTSKADGLGLGLTICYNIARAHGGFIDVQSKPGQGATFTVGLPLASS